jgi:hypothetical protein
MGLSMGQPVKDWIEASLGMNYMRKSGEIQAADFRRAVRDIRAFEDALITEIGFPALDGSSKESAYMALKFAPTRVRNKKGDGSAIAHLTDMEQKMWHPTDFRFTIDGYEQACARVQKVEAITIQPSGVRAQRDQVHVDRQQRHPVDVPRLKFTLLAADAEPFFAWDEDFVINGHNAGEAHKVGQLVYLDRTRQKDLLTLTLSGLGIFKLSAESPAHNGAKSGSVMVEMYCESVTAKFA